MIQLCLKTTIFLILFAFIAASYTQTNTNAVDEKTGNLYVLVKYKTQPDKQDAALSSLNALILEVKKEPHFVNIKMLVDQTDKTNVLLFEEWSDEAYYKGDHMNTPHLLKFRGEARGFLAGPPEITFWVLNNIYTAD